jgi:hypothetical protein
VTAALWAWLAQPVPSPSGAVTGPSLPGLPSVAVPAGTPVWLVVLGYLFVFLGALATGGVLVKLVDARLTRRRVAAEAERTEVEADEVLTRVAVTLVEPLRDRVEKTERRLAEALARHERERAAWEERYERERRQWEERRQVEREAFEAEVDGLRAKVREALVEADGAATEAHRLRRLVQQWHRAIMDPSATIEWLRQLVGPDEPSM